MSCMASFVGAESPTVSMLVGGAGPSPADCQALPDIVVAGPLVRQGQVLGQLAAGPMGAQG